jgi:hypothetical protein
MVSVCYAVPTWFSVHFQRPTEHDFGDCASHVGKQVFSEHLCTVQKKSAQLPRHVPDRRKSARQMLLPPGRRDPRVIGSDDQIIDTFCNAMVEGWDAQRTFERLTHSV